MKRKVTKDLDFGPDWSGAMNAELLTAASAMGFEWDHVDVSGELLCAAHAWMLSDTPYKRRGARACPREVADWLAQHDALVRRMEASVGIGEQGDPFDAGAMLRAACDDAIAAGRFPSYSAIAAAVAAERGQLPRTAQAHLARAFGDPNASAGTVRAVCRVLGLRVTLQPSP